MPRTVSHWDCWDRRAEAIAHFDEATRSCSPEEIHELADQAELMGERSFHIEVIADDEEGGGSMKIKTGLRESCGTILKSDSRMVVLSFAQAA